MPNVLDLQVKVSDDFEGLAEAPYLAAMWVVGAELSLIYGSAVGGSSDLIAQTLDCVRRAYDQEADPLEARRLAAAWRTYISQNEDWVSGGLVNYWVVLEDLAGELSGLRPQRFATSRLTNAAILDLPSPAESVFEGFTVVLPSADADDDSPRIKRLRRLEMIAARIGELQLDKQRLTLEQVQALIQ